MIRLFLTLLAVGATALADPPTSVPALARIASVSVGRDTMETLEKRLGPGLPGRGGHARSLRTWRVKGAVLSADGFNSFDRRGVSYAGGRQIDSFWLGASSDTSGLPRADVSADDLKFMGRVRLGAEKAEVLKQLATVLPPPVEEKDGALVWKAKGFVRVSHVNHYATTEWTARLVFKNGRLEAIGVSCDQGSG